MKSYLLSIPERLIRAVLGLGAGAAREVGRVALPDGVRNSQLYQNLVDTTLRFLIENVGGAEGVYKSSGSCRDDFFVRRTAGNAVEVLGIVAFRASPVWVLAALADLCGVGRQLIPEIAGALKAQGLLEKDARVRQRGRDARRPAANFVPRGGSDQYPAARRGGPSRGVGSDPQGSANIAAGELPDRRSGRRHVECAQGRVGATAENRFSKRHP